MHRLSLAAASELPVMVASRCRVSALRPMGSVVITPGLQRAGSTVVARA